MKILLTLHAKLDYNAGAASVILSLKDEYLSLGHQVETLSYDDLPKFAKSYAEIVFPFFVAWRLLTRYRSFDVVDASAGDAWLAYSLPRPASKQLRVSHSHGLQHLMAGQELSAAAAIGKRVEISKRVWRYGLRLSQVFRALVKSDLVLVLNESEKDYLVGRGIDAGKIRRVHLGVRLPLQPAGIIAEPGRITVIQLGSYIERKGIAETRDAMTAILRQFPEVRLVFAGTGTQADTVHAHYPADLHDRISVVPRYRNEDLPEILRQASILLMPSHFEGYGIAKLEAMTCGVVPIVSDDPGTAADMVDGVNCLIVPVGNAPALRAAIARLVSEPALRAALAKAGMETARNLRWGTLAAQRIVLYRQFRQPLSS